MDAALEYKWVSEDKGHSDCLKIKPQSLIGEIVHFLSEGVLFQGHRKRKQQELPETITRGTQEQGQPGSVLSGPEFDRLDHRTKINGAKGRCTPGTDVPMGGHIQASSPRL